MPRPVKWILSALLAALVVVVLMSVLQTQGVLAMLPATAPSVGSGERAAMTAYDLRHLGLLLAQVVPIAVLVAFGVSELVARFVPVRLRVVVFTIAGAVAIFVLLRVMKAQFFGVDIIAGARTWWGYALMTGSGAVGGALMAALTRRKRRSRYSVKA